MLMLRRYLYQRISLSASLRFKQEHDSNNNPIETKTVPLS